MALAKNLNSAGLSAPTADDCAPRPDGNRPPSLLIVDDSVDNRALLRAFLKHTPFEVDEAPNGVVAVAKAKAKAYDFILMDLLMPEMGGFDATRAIRSWEALQGTKPACIIALTAWALTAEIVKSGADLHLTKPTTKAKLLEVLNTRLQRVGIGNRGSIAR
jgi:two-component system, sensor histidine kinase